MKLIYTCVPQSYKGEGVFCSRKTYENQVNLSTYKWIDSYRKNANIGDIFCFVQNKSKNIPGFVRCHRILSVSNETTWGDIDDARILCLSDMLWDMPYAKWIAHGGCKRVSRTYYNAIGTKENLLKSIIYGIESVEEVLKDAPSHQSSDIAESQKRKRNYRNFLEFATLAQMTDA